MLLSNLKLLAAAPGGVARLRELILTLAVQGKLVPQDPKDEPASELLKKIRVEKDRLIAEGRIKRDKALAEIADEEKPFELPRGWEWVRLGDLANLTYGKNLPTTNLTEDGFQVFGANGVIGRYSEYLYDDEQLLISCRGAYSGKPNISPRKCFVTNNSIVCEFVERSMVDLGFFYRQLQITDKSRLVTGSAQPQVTIANADPLVLVVPPLAEQTRIVTSVEELMRLCDALEAKGQLAATAHAQLVSTLLATLTESETPAQLADSWHRIATHFDLLLDRPEAVDALEQTILQLAVRGLLVPQDPQDEPASALLHKIRTEKDKLIAEGKIKRDKPLPPIAEHERPFALPLGWEWVRLGDIGYTNIGLTYSPNDVSETGTPVLRSNNVQAGKLDLSDLKRVNMRVKESVLVAEGDLLICARNGSKALVGKTALITGITEPMAFGAFMAIFRSDVNGYVLHFINSQLFRRMISDVNTTTINQITQENLRGTIFPMPPLAEQSRIVTRVAQLRRLCADLRQRLAASQSTQAHLAEALVQEVA